jgi:hypothetical protein
MTTKNIALSCLTACGLFAGLSAQAAEPTVQQILNGITQGGSSGATQVSASSDQVWSIGGSGINAQILFTRNSSFANAFGIYDVNTGSRLEVFSGTTSVGARRSVTINGAGLVKVIDVDIPALLGQLQFTANRFGFYIDTGADIYYSEQSRNGGTDRMLAFQGNGSDVITLPGGTPGVWGQNEFAIFFEDGTDFDFNDIGVFAESISPVPEGGTTVLLLGLALSGLAIARRKLS